MGLGSHRSPCSVSAFETTGDSPGAGARILRLFEQAVLLRDAGLRRDWGDMTGCKTLMLVALASLVARGGDGGDDSSTDSVAPAATVAATTTGAPETVAPTTTVPEVPASANPIDQGVGARLGADEFEAVTTPIEVVTGDRFRTDGSGFAEVVYPDGSLTRLDVDTEFEIVSITDDDGAATTRTSLDTGRVWNRVQTLGGEDEFLLETSVAMATVRGTAFVVECPYVDPCTFTALEPNELITQKDLASISGAVRPTVNRAVNDLPGGQGVALPRNLPPIVDAVRFAELAGQG